MTPPVLLLLLPLLPLLRPAQGDSCVELRDAFLRRLHERKIKLNIIERTLRAEGEDAVLQVWGAGGAGRAAAAVLLAVLRELLGYAAQARPERADVCRLLRRRSGRPLELAVVAPAAALARGGCGPGPAWALDELTALREPAVPAEPLLLLHAPSAECAQRAARWGFYSNVSAEARACNFSMTPANAAGEGERFTALVGGASAYDERVAERLRLRVRALPVAVQRVATDFELRRRIAELRQANRAFLFVDEDIWVGDAHVVRVQPPPCAAAAAHAACPAALLEHGAVRVGTGAFMRTYAPPVADVARLPLSPADLRAVLADEQASGNMTAAACRWARDHVRAVVELFDWQKKRRREYVVRVLPCSDDPDLAALRAAAGRLRDALRGRTRRSVHYEFRGVDCSSEEALRRAVGEAAARPAVCALVAWAAAAGARAAAAEARGAGLPLRLLGGAAAARARALRRLLALCGWARVAVLSDRAAYSRELADALLAGAPPLVARELAVDSAAAVASALAELRQADARVVVVNADWAAAERVLCGAARLRLGARTVWLVREVRARPACAAGLRVLSLGAAWRGGGAPARGWVARLALGEALGGRAGAPGPAHGAALVEALAQLTLGFDAFLSEHPSHSIDFRHSALVLEKYLDNVTGVASPDGDNSAPDPADAYVEDWSEERGRVVAAWRLAPGAVRQLWPAGAAACAAPAPDRPACRTASTGDAFAPRCQDVPVFASAAFLLLAALALLAAWRARRARLRRRERAWRTRLEQQRRRAASLLGAFLVDRAAVRLLHEIGSGCFGRVHFAELRRPGGATLVVAAKQPRAGAAPAEEGEFLREACVLAPLAHAHVVRLVGVCVADGPPMVLMEHALHLDLQRYLTERRGRAAGARGELAARALTRLAREAAAALQYLAARRLVHRDVRAANCLVDERRALKLADFGLARELDAAEPEYATTRRGLFPVLWMAPESLARGAFSLASDVWALGVLLLELATLGARPFGSWAPAQALRHVAAGGHAPLPPDLAPHTRELLLACWRRAPEQRPSAASVRSALAANPEAVRPSFLPPLLPPLPPPPPPPMA